MPKREELISAYQAALTDHAENTKFVLFRNPNETGKNVEGRLTQHNGNFYVKTLTQFYFLQNTPEVQQIFSKDQNVHFNFTPEEAKLNNIPVNATLIK